MEKRGSMQIREIFRFRDGRTVFVGSLEGGEHAMIRPGQCDLYVGDKKVATIRIEPEMIPQRVDPLERHNERAVSTTDDPGLTKEAVAAGICRLEVPMTIYGHRHLLGIDSPPDDYVPDDLTLGPRLPDGWDGDAWMRPQGGGHFLRAWNKATGRYAIATGNKYEEARQRLLDEIRHGQKRVVITASQGSGA